MEAHMSRYVRDVLPKMENETHQERSDSKCCLDIIDTVDYGHFKCFKRFFETSNTIMHNIGYEKYCKLRDIDLFLRQFGGPNQIDILSLCLLRGRLDFAKYAYKHGSNIGNYSLFFSIMGKCMKCFIFSYEIGAPILEHMGSYAACYGTLEMIKFAIKHNWSWHPRTLSYILTYQEFENFEYVYAKLPNLRKTGFTLGRGLIGSNMFDNKIIKKIIENSDEISLSYWLMDLFDTNNIEIIKYLMNRCERFGQVPVIPFLAIITLMKSNNKEILNYVLDNNLLPSNFCYDYSDLIFDNYSIEKYARKSEYKKLLTLDELTFLKFFHNSRFNANMAIMATNRFSKSIEYIKCLKRPKDQKIVHCYLCHTHELTEELDDSLKSDDFNKSNYQNMVQCQRCDIFIHSDCLRTVITPAFKCPKCKKHMISFYYTDTGELGKLED